MSRTSCLLTGAGRGIGRAVALRLTRAGMDVLAVARTEADLKETASLCREHPGRCEIYPADVTCPDEVAAAAGRCVELFGRLDVLINNAGVAPLSALTEITDETYRQAMAVNCDGVFYACRAAWPHLVTSQGVIVNVSSAAAEDPFPGFSVYGATKAWVNTFSRALSDEGRETGIRVYSVAPGAVETPLMRELFPDFPAEKALDPDDVAGMIEVLLDPRCRYASGRTIPIGK